MNSLTNLRLRAVLSLILIVLFIIVFISGFMLIKKSNSNSTIEKVHILSGIIFTIFILIHFFSNKKIFINELKTLISYTH